MFLPFFGMKLWNKRNSLVCWTGARLPVNVQKSLSLIFYTLLCFCERIFIQKRDYFANDSDYKVTAVNKFVRNETMKVRTGKEFVLICVKLHLATLSKWLDAAHPETLFMLPLWRTLLGNSILLHPRIASEREKITQTNSALGCGKTMSALTKKGAKRIWRRRRRKWHNNECK
jgi:hypothetical protein